MCIRDSDALIRQLEALGFTTEAANAYADQLGLIPKDIGTNVALNGVELAAARLDKLTTTRYADIIARVVGTDRVTPGVDRAYASGGVLNGPTRILAGEAGAEAIVPLNRSLSQVDPSVRWLSAIAQGKVPAMASGGIVGGGNQTTIAEGAIVIRGAVDSRRTALDVVDAIAERTSS